MEYSNNTRIYLQDLDLAQPTRDLEFLQELQSRHIARYSFNSLAVLQGQAISIESDGVFDKIVTQGRGGYCFEHNKLVFDVLQELGFDVRILLARVINNRDIDAPRTHRITLVNLPDGHYIVDAGFGSLCPRYPLKLELETMQDQGDASYRLIRNTDGDYCIQLRKDDGFFSLYTFDTNRYTEADCRTGHFYSHRFPDAVFVNNLVVSRKFFNETHSLVNGEYHLTKNAQTKVTKICNAAELANILTQVFEQKLDAGVVEDLYHRFVVEA